jgi:hypothetical protein
MPREMRLRLRVRIISDKSNRRPPDRFYRLRKPVKHSTAEEYKHELSHECVKIGQKQGIRRPRFNSCTSKSCRQGETEDEDPNTFLHKAWNYPIPPNLCNSFWYLEAFRIQQIETCEKDAQDKRAGEGDEYKQWKWQP